MSELETDLAYELGKATAAETFADVLDALALKLALLVADAFKDGMIAGTAGGTVAPVLASWRARGRALVEPYAAELRITARTMAARSTDHLGGNE
jgi:hypothetical protein